MGAWRDHLFLVEAPEQRAGGWWSAIVGQRRWEVGPLADPQAVDRALHERFRRWASAARARGGWAWKAGAREWVLTLPLDCPSVGLPFAREPCARHEPLPATGR